MKKKIFAISLIISLIVLCVACSKDDEIDQTEKPKTGDTTVQMKVKDFGVIKIRMFKEAAPKAVENFITHAKEGYYDGLIFHRVMNDFMIQGGDPTGTGAGGESIWGKAFEDEYTSDLIPIRGALCMANAGPNTNGSQFFIVQAKSYQEQYVSELENEGVPKKLIDYFKENGGTAHLYKNHTVFGQVYEGMDVVDAIAAVSVSKEKPDKDVVIEKIEVSE